VNPSSNSGTTLAACTSSGISIQTGPGGRFWPYGRPFLDDAEWCSVPGL